MRARQGFFDKDGFSLLEVIVALAILGVSIVSLIELFSVSLKTVKKSADYSKGIIIARSEIDKAYSLLDVSDIQGTEDLGGGYESRKTVKLVSSEEGVRLYEIAVTVSWPGGRTTLNGLRTFYEED